MSDVPPATSRFVTLRNAFFSGALLLAPLLVTVWAFLKIIELLGGTFRPVFDAYLPKSLQGYGLLWDLLATMFVVLLVTLLGFVSHYLFGKILLRAVEEAGHDAKSAGVHRSVPGPCRPPVNV